jgi:hypothetical protein
MQSLQAYITAAVPGSASYCAATQTPAAFETMTMDIFNALGSDDLGFSIHDQFAALYARMAQARCLSRKDLRDTPLLRDDIMGDLQKYRFFIPVVN